MQSQQKMVLSDDGELRNLAEEVAQPAVYCIHCGTANRADGHFCRACGQALDDQAVTPDSYLPPEHKNKRAETAKHAGRSELRRTPPPMTAGMVIVELFTLLAMSGLLLAALFMNQIFIAIAILIAWLIVEAARHGQLN